MTKTRTAPGFYLLEANGTAKLLSHRIPHTTDYRKLSTDNPSKTYMVVYPQATPEYYRSGQRINVE